MKCRLHVVSWSFNMTRKRALLCGLAKAVDGTVKVGGHVVAAQERLAGARVAAKPAQRRRIAQDLEAVPARRCDRRCPESREFCQGSIAA
jgi:hypothetical protein